MRGLLLTVVRNPMFQGIAISDLPLCHVKVDIGVLQILKEFNACEDTMLVSFRSNESVVIVIP